MEGSERAPAAAPSDRAARIGRLGLRDFRNFADLEVELPPAGVAVVGPNGSGKTNLLEAIYYLDTFRSFRGASDRELIRFGEDVFRIEATLHGPGEDERTELAAAYRSRGRRKKVEVDRREVSRLSDAVGKLGAVVFSLEDVEIVRGSPSERRRFLDILLSLIEPGYMEALREYRSVLSQRNEALKEGAGAAVVDAWTEGLVETGARVMAARAGWIADRVDDYRGYHEAVAGGMTGSLSYEPETGWPEDRDRARSASPGGPGEPVGSGEAVAAGAWEGCFARALEETAERERRRGVTVTGPHRDEVAFEAQVQGEPERDLRTYGSGGQQRTAALALRLVEADSLRDRLDREPIYLLDDVFAELDEERSERLMGLLEEGRTGQVVVTSPRPSDMELRGGGLEEWRIRDGEVTT